MDIGNKTCVDLGCPYLILKTDVAGGTYRWGHRTGEVISPMPEGGSITEAAKEAIRREERELLYEEVLHLRKPGDMSHKGERSYDDLIWRRDVLRLLEESQ